MDILIYMSTVIVLQMVKNTHTLQKIVVEGQNMSRALLCSARLYRCFKTRIVVKSTKTNVQSLNWSSDWKFFSGVSDASIVKKNGNGTVNKIPTKESNINLVCGRKERSVVSTAKISLNNNECVMINKGHVYQPIADTNCNVRDNTFQGVPTLNTMMCRIKMI